MTLKISKKEKWEARYLVLTDSEYERNCGMTQHQTRLVVWSRSYCGSKLKECWSKLKECEKKVKVLSDQMKKVCDELTKALLSQQRMSLYTLIICCLFITYFFHLTDNPFTFSSHSLNLLLKLSICLLPLSLSFLISSKLSTVSNSCFK